MKHGPGANRHGQDTRLTGFGVLRTLVIRRALTWPRALLLVAITALAVCLLLAPPVGAGSSTGSGAAPALTPTATPTATSACPAAWHVVGSPSPGSGGLRAVAVVAANDVWAVGDYGGRTLTLHWDGDQWRDVYSPNRGTGENHLFAASAVAANDVWAGGWDYDPTAGRWVTLIEHWDGTQWSILPSANQNSVQNYLSSMSAASAQDVWAVGYYSGRNGYQTLTEHWDGQQWSIVPSPNLGPDNNIFYAVATIGSNDVWAVGDYSSGPNTLSLAEHWDGTQWAVVSTPNPAGMRAADLFSIGAAASNDVWAAGAANQAPGVSPTLIEHWDGTQWSIVPSPNLDQGFNEVQGVAAISPTDAWVAGYFAGNYGATLIAHWDGQQWSLVTSPHPGANDNYLFAVAAVASGDVWAVGEFDNCLGCTLYTLTEHYVPQCPPASPSPSVTSAPTLAPSATATPSVSAAATSPTPAATATRTPPATPATRPPVTPSATVNVTGTAMVTATATPPPPTSVTASATACPSQFSDVHPVDYFYEPVLYLACHGVISGYADGTFRPYNNTTRAQMVKIVVLGFQTPNVTPASGTYTFADVGPAFPFFAVIETAAAASVVSGYACGGPSEPCDPQQRPYFRPYANVTRGQLAKIDVVAADWPLLNPASPSFTDVPPGSAFYRFAETAVCHGVLSGYADRTFRPGAPATRGQISKIVYLSLPSNGGSCNP